LARFYSLSLGSRAFAQELPDIPDSVYIKNQVIIWFQEGVLNRYYLGCDILGLRAEGKPLLDESLPLSTDFIFSQAIVNYLAGIGVKEMHKMVPAINPCQDTVSFSVSGDVIRMPDFWNAIVVTFETDQNIPNLAYVMQAFFHQQILWAQPNFIYSTLERGGISEERVSGFGDMPARMMNSGYPNDKYWIAGNQRALSSSSPGDANVDSAWYVTKGDPRVNIGIVDGGFDYRHPDLGGSVGANYRVRGAWNYESPISKEMTWIPQTLDANSHGTSTASIIGAISNNDSVGVAGICGGDGSATSGASIYCLAAMTSATISNAVWEATANTGNLPPPDGSGHLWLCDILCFSQAVKDVGGGDPKGFGLKDEIMRSVMAFRYQNGRTTFCAYGNGKNQHKLSNADTTFARSPQDVDKEWVINVSATYRAAVANTEDYGENLDLLAVTGTYACALDGPDSAYVYKYRQYTNTSCAAPVAAGVGGLLLSLHKQLTTVRDDSIPPFLYAEDIEWLMKHSAQQDTTGNIWNNGWGAVKANRTIRKLLYPYVLKHDSIPYANETQLTYEIDTLKIAFPGWTRDATWQPFQGGNDDYQVKRYHLVQTVPIDKNRLRIAGAAIERIWGRGANPHTGFGNPLKLRKMRFRLPLYRVGWCAVVNDTAYTQDSVTLETYVYAVRRIFPGGQLALDSMWIPHPPDSTMLTYSILARVTSPTYVSREPAAPEGPFVDIFPIPALGQTQVLIHAPTKDRCYAEFYNVFGRKERTLKLDATTLEHGENLLALDCGNTPPGVYLAVIHLEHAPILVRKFVIAR
jgi:subtilisin family serine protease